MEFDIPDIQISAKRSHLEDLGKKLQDPSQQSDYREIGRIVSEYKQLEQVINLWDDIDHKLQEYKEAEELLNDDDADMSALAQDSITDLESKIPLLLEKLQEMTLPKLENDDNNGIFEVRAGTGGREASLFADEVMRMYIRYINSQGYKIEQLHTSYHEEGGIKEAIFSVEGPRAYGNFRFESGVHRVQRVPVTEANGRIHTSTISVVVLPEIEPAQVNIQEQDLRIDVYRSSGPGGQSVNTTDSAVRITHIPSGISAACQDSKSQHKNKEKAMSILVSRLYAIQQEEKSKAAKDIRSEAIRGGDRSAKVRTYNFPQGRITDHRVNMSWFNIQTVMEGYLDEIVPVVNLKLRQEISQL